MLVLFGLILRTSDARLVEMCRAFFQRFPNSEAMSPFDTSAATEAHSIVRKGQVPFVESLTQLLSEPGEVPRNFGGLSAVKGVGIKVAECVLAYGWGEDALPVDGQVFRVAARIW